MKSILTDNKNSGKREHTDLHQNGDSFYTDHLTDVLKNDYDDRMLRAERIESRDNAFTDDLFDIIESRNSNECDLQRKPL